MKVTIVVKEHEFGLEVAKEDSVMDIKHKIQQILGASIESQTLSVLGWELVDGLDMEDYPIVAEGTRINLALSSVELDYYSRSSHKIPLVIKFSSKKYKIDVDTTETVRSLKEKIQIMDGTPLRRMILYFQGNELVEDFHNLSEYGIKEFSEIVVYLNALNRMKDDPPCKWLNVVVQTSSAILNSARFPLEVKDLSTISELRQLLLCRKILPMDDYIFIHKQRTMRDNCSLRWHGVENGDFIYVFKGVVSHDK